MDDDIFMSIRSLKKFIEEYNYLSLNSCFAPRININNKNNNYGKSYIITKIQNLILFFNPNPRAGTISITSFPVQHSRSEFHNRDFDKVDWLPGGILILQRKDIIDRNYFKFKGKAYCEDLIHSFLLKKNGINLYISNNCFCNTSSEPYKNQSIINFSNFIVDDFSARNFFRKISKRPLIPMVIVYIFIIFNYLTFQFRNLFKLK